MFAQRESEPVRKKQEGGRAGRLSIFYMMPLSSGA